MDRIYAMSQAAKLSCTCGLSDNTIHTPTKFLVEGESNKYGYRISHVNDNHGTTYIKLDAPERHLRVSTFKSMRGYLYTSCQAVKKGNSSGGFSSESFIMFQDYNKTIMQFTDVKRVNEKVITDCHYKALANIETFVKEANEMYKDEC